MTVDNGETLNRSAKALLVAGLLVQAVFMASLISPIHFLNPLFPEGAHNIGEGQGSDFFAFYQAGRYILEGRDPYTDPLEDPDTVVPYAYFYRYLPFVAYTLGIAANAVSPFVAYWIWVTLVECTLALCIWMTARMVTDRSLLARLTAMWLMFTPFYIEQYMGQLTFVMAALVFAMVFCHSRGRTRGFDWSWILSVLTKHLTILFVPVFLRLRRHRAIVICLCLVVAATLPHILIFGSAGLSKFRHDNFELAIRSHAGNFAVLALVKVLKDNLFPVASRIAIYAGPMRLSLTRVLMLFTMLTPVLSSLWVTFRRKPFDLAESLGLWTMTYFFVFFEVWEYHYVLLMPVLVLFYAKSRARLLWVIYTLLAMPTLFVLYDLPLARPQEHWTAAEQILNHGFKVVPLVWLFIWTARGGLRRHSKRLEGMTDNGLRVPV